MILKKTCAKNTFGNMIVSSKVKIDRDFPK